MQKIYLTFKDKKEFENCFKDNFDDNNKIISKPGFEFSVIGKLFKNNGKYDENGDTVKEPTQIKGFHVNMLVSEENLSKIPKNKIVNPKSPQRVFGI